jgi:hypothetical protein
MKKTVRYVSWNVAEARQPAGVLRSAGYAVRAGPIKGPDELKGLKFHPPDALVIDLSRLPSQGRDIALSVRFSRATRHVPIVFVGGEPEKVTRVRAVLPDAVYADHARLRGAIRSAITHPPADPAVPESVFAGYSGKPLPEKLGVKRGMTVVIQNAPKGFLKHIEDFPPGIRIRRSGPGELTIWFCRSMSDLNRNVADRCRNAEGGKLWIAWPKKGSPLASDIGEKQVRIAGLGQGWVDFKICAIDDVWSGLLFARRQAKRTKAASGVRPTRRGG